MTIHFFQHTMNCAMRRDAFLFCLKFFMFVIFVYQTYLFSHFVQFKSGQKKHHIFYSFVCVCMSHVRVRVLGSRACCNHDQTFFCVCVQCRVCACVCVCVSVCVSVSVANTKKTDIQKHMCVCENTQHRQRQYICIYTVYIGYLLYFLFTRFCPTPCDLFF